MAGLSHRNRLKSRLVCTTFGDCLGWCGKLPLLALLLKPVFICNLIPSTGAALCVGTVTCPTSSMSVLWILMGGPLSLYVHRDICHLVNVLDPRHFNRLLYASNGKNLSLIRQISSLLYVLRVLSDSCPTDSGHEPHSCVQLQTWT